MKLNKKDIKEVKESIKENLEEDFIENYGVWKRSLDDINQYIKKEVDDLLIVSSFNENLLYTYDELCQNSLLIVDKIKVVSKKDVEPTKLSKLITNEVAKYKISEIIKNHIDDNNFYNRRTSC